MAQIVGYFENDVVYVEGPFVVVQINGWRVEVAMTGQRCPVLPDVSIYNLYKKEKGENLTKYNSLKQCVVAVDWLNEQVRNKNIVLEGAVWISYQGVCIGCPQHCPH